MVIEQEATPTVHEAPRKPARRAVSIGLVVLGYFAAVIASSWGLQFLVFALIAAGLARWVYGKQGYARWVALGFAALVLALASTLMDVDVTEGNGNEATAEFGMPLDWLTQCCHPDNVAGDEQYLPDIPQDTPIADVAPERLAVNVLLHAGLLYLLGRVMPRQPESSVQ